MTALHVVLPASVHDPARPSGGNTYDRRMCGGLSASGWTVHERSVPGDWPRPDARSRARVAQALREVPDGALVLLDGLVASAVPDALAAESGRLRLVVLVHLPLGVDGTGRGVRAAEEAALTAARGVLTTSRWTREWLLSTYRLSGTGVSVVTPGVDRAALTAHDDAGARVLCVGAVTPAKGQDVLVAALGRLADLGWSCTLVGSTRVDAGFSDGVLRQATAAGIAHRVHCTGPLAGPGLDAEYGRADLLVCPSRTETFGMVVTEASARGIPALAADVGGLPEALGHTRQGLPGILVPSDDPAALAGALRRWLSEPALRQRLWRAARHRRADLRSWTDASACLSRVLEEVAA